MTRKRPQPWSGADTRTLRNLVSQGWLTPRIAEHMDRAPSVVRSNARRLGIELNTSRQSLTPEQGAEITRRYPTESAADIASCMGLKISTVYNAAQRLGLSKSAEWVAERARQNWQDGLHDTGRATQFQPDQTPWNKGVAGSTGNHPNSRRTQFKPGACPTEAHNYQPIGSHRVTRDGYVERKMNDDHPVPARRWVGVHRLVWEAARGRIPDNHVVVFRPGAHTTDPEQITIDRLECISRGELMERNSIQRYPEELRVTMQQIGRLNNRIKRSKSA